MMNRREKQAMKVLETGTGELFPDPDPDQARAEFRKKSRKMTRKLMPLKEAVETELKILREEVDPYRYVIGRQQA
jgi:hypothetical protein